MKKTKLLKFPTLAILALSVVAGASAGTVTGVVHNGTTGKLAAGVDVLLIQLQGGMQVVANTKTDSEGRYNFDSRAIGQGPMLLRAVYQGVNFHQPLTPGLTTVDLTVYEKTKSPTARQITSRLIVLQPNGASLLVGEEYTISNQSQPPAAFYDEQGDFEFQAPDGADVQQVSAWGPSGMPVVQATIDKGKNRYAIAWAFQPGDNGVRISYQIPYSSNSANLMLASPYQAQRVLIAAPPTVQVSSEGFQPSGNEQGYSVYSHDQVAANSPVIIAVSGTAPPPSGDASGGSDGGGGAEGGGGGGGGDQLNGRDSGASVQVLPTRLDSLRWVLIGGFAAIFALGLVYLWRRSVQTAIPAVATGPGDAGFAMQAPRQPSQANRGSISDEEPTREARPAAPNASSAREPGVATEQLNREVGQSLDALKDNLFKLELRRQAGTISEEDYARERARAEKVLRDLLRG